MHARNFSEVLFLTLRQICARIRLLVLDRQKNKQALAAVEHETSCIRTQLGESIQKNANLNAEVQAATLVSAKLQEDFKVTLERESAEAATAKQSFEQEIARLRAEISANPAPDEKCSFSIFSSIHFTYFKLTCICRRGLLGSSCLGALRRQKCSSKLRQGSHPGSKERSHAQRTRPIDDGVFD